jgi:hypothetical protein
MLVRRQLVLPVCLAAVLATGGLRTHGDDPPRAAGNAPAESAEAPQNKDEPLSSTQETISRRFKRFEDTLRKIAESLRKTDPERADLLVRAIGKSYEYRINGQMTDLVQLLRDNKQLGDAIERQGDVVTQLHSLLDLLLSEDRQKELKEEQARIKKYIEELNKIIARQKGTRADNERGAPAGDVADAQKKIADQTDKLGRSIDKDDQAKQARSRQEDASKSKPGDGQSGKEGQEGKPGEGDSKEGKSNEGKPGENKPGESKPGENKPGEQNPGESKPGESKPGESQPGENKPGENKPGENQPGETKPGENKPGENKPGEPKPGEGKPNDGQPNQGQPNDGQPQEGQPGKPQEGQPGQQSPSGDSKPQNQQQTPGRDELEKARRAMEQAIERLKKAQRHEASDEQDEAIANLQKAKEKLEEILRQLREEERERFLAMLEARFQRMLAMQLLVYDGTVKVAKMSDADGSGRRQAGALKLARQQEEIAVDATKAIVLLREEGTAVAFPEAVEQVRDDMRIVESRLERTDPGELTQGIEREIIDALEEMIEALQKEMEKSKDKDKDKNQQQNEGQQQEPPLVEQLAELKMLRTLQLRVNNRTKRLGRMIEGEQALENDLVEQLQNLADRQARIQKDTHELATGKNK